jgi:hypothetical protein
VRYQPDKKHLRAVEEGRLFETPYRSPQLALWELDDTEWLTVIRRPDDAPRQARQEPPRQASLSLSPRRRVVRMICLDRRTDVRYTRLGG